MEVFGIKNLSFTYNKAEKPVLSRINLSINQGEFALIIGESGCGKTTLLRLLKKELIPYGKIQGEIFFKGKLIDDIPPSESASSVGFIMQDPDSQIVTDKVYSELAFGLESLGEKPDVIRARVAEFASYFGLTDKFDAKTYSLSGGEKQLLNLASVMCMNPEVIILDEPVSMLDPISSMEFINTLKRLNNDFGITVIVAEHHLQDIYAIADRVAYIENGEIAAAGSPRSIVNELWDKKIAMTLPVPARVFGALGYSGEIPLTVREGRKVLTDYASGKTDSCPDKTINYVNKVLNCKDVFFRYDKKSKDVLKGCTLSVYNKEFYSIVGANGSGKSTLLKILSGIQKPYRGRVKCEKKVSYLPQNPRDIFVKDVLEEDFKSINNSYLEICELFGIANLLKMHPYDLSGGEIQRAAICKLLLTEPELILLDEPTKGLDAFAKKTLGDFLLELRERGITILVVTHDLEFAAEYSDRCGLLFDGAIVSENNVRDFFSTNNYYTTVAARMSKNILKSAVTPDDIIMQLGGGR